MENNIVSELKKHNITHVLSLVEDIEYQPNFFHTPMDIDSLRMEGFTVVHCPTKDFGIHDNNMIQDIMQHIDDITSSGGKIFIHCRSGIGRAPTIGIMYFSKKKGLNIIDAIEFVTYYRPEINMSKQQMRSLVKYESN